LRLYDCLIVKKEKFLATTKTCYAAERENVLISHLLYDSNDRNPALINALEGEKIRKAPRTPVREPYDASKLTLICMRQKIGAPSGLRQPTR